MKNLLNMKSLLITLGHNSSAIFINKDKVIGYEEERLTGIKSDSRFPRNAINEIIKNVGSISDSIVYISHWFDFTPNESISDKYNGFIPSKYMTKEDYIWLKEITNSFQDPVDNFICVNPHFTHHDAHAWSGFNFYKYYLNDSQKNNYKTGVLVCDGFGNDKEVMSLYETNDQNTDLKLLKRVNGYKYSVGLLYQYATSYVGMKENQDEYKFLGYESHLNEYFSTSEISSIEDTANKYIIFLYNMWSGKVKPEVSQYNTDELISFSELKETKEFIWFNLNNLCDKFKDKNLDENNKFIKRILVGHFIQYILEQITYKIISDYDINNLIVVGGSFYNVKLNNYLLKHIKGNFCAMPLAGDQGASIGMYSYYSSNDFNFEKLTIGKRDFYNAKKTISSRFPKDAKFVEIRNREESLSLSYEISDKLSQGYIVNIVQNNMEFGPRALCSTTSLFMPNELNASNCDFINKRNSVMPFAPVMLDYNYHKMFEDNETSRIVGSDYFMICTHRYKDGFWIDNDLDEYKGAACKMPNDTYGFSGRPQVINSNKESLIKDILESVEEKTGYKCLVNTSYNVHGQPIVFSLSQILLNYEYQLNRAELKNIKTFIYIIDNKSE